MYGQHSRHLNMEGPLSCHTFSLNDLGFCVLDRKTAPIPRHLPNTRIQWTCTFCNPKSSREHKHVTGNFVALVPFRVITRCRKIVIFISSECISVHVFYPLKWYSGDCVNVFYIYFPQLSTILHIYFLTFHSIAHILPRFLQY